MAKGFPDYWRGTVGLRSNRGKPTIEFQDTNYENVASGSTDAVLSYTVPDGYYMYLRSVLVSTSECCNHYILIDVTPVTYYTIYFDDMKLITMEPAIIERQDPGTTVLFRVHNGYDYLLTFRVGISGLLEII